MLMCAKLTFLTEGWKLAYSAVQQTMLFPNTAAERNLSSAVPFTVRSTSLHLMPLSLCLKAASGLFIIWVSGKHWCCPLILQIQIFCTRNGCYGLIHSRSCRVVLTPVVRLSGQFHGLIIKWDRRRRLSRLSGTIGFPGEHWAAVQTWDKQGYRSSLRSGVICK